jgi:acetolactate synthase-1/2/3 large subunit
LREATEGRPGPVLVEIPIDVLFGRVPVDDVVWPDLARPSRPSPGPEQVAEAVQTLLRAKRPAILCGGGMLYAQAAEALHAFASVSGIPVYANSKARGVMPADHPLCAGPHTNIKVAEAAGIGGPDVLLVLGARFGMFTEPGMLGPGRIPADDCRIIQVNVSAAELGRIRPVQLALQADCRATLNALIDAACNTRWPDWSEWSTAVRGLCGWHRQAYAEALSPSDGARPIHPYRAVTEVVRALGNDVIVCADGGEASFWAEVVAAPKRAGALMSHGYLGCLGIGVPFAIGAQVAHPERRVAVITGDGSMGFHLQEFDTLVRHDLPVVTVVLNNKAWGMCVHGQESMYGGNRLVATRLADARYDLAAAAMGCHAEYVERAEEIAPAVERALASGRPACIEIVVDLGARPVAAGSTAAAARSTDDVVLPYYDA